MAGAPILCGRAALRMGSGLVQIAVADLAHTASIAASPELVGLPGAPRLESIIEAAKKADVVAVGPGWGTSAANRETLLALLKLDVLLVIDADALNLLATDESRAALIPSESRGVSASGSGPGTARLSFAARTVLTPHPGEMKRLATTYALGEFGPADDAQRATVAKKMAALTGGVVLLKGKRTVIAQGDEIRVNTTGDSSLSKAGTGDVLTGVIASLIGQGMSPFDAATLGAYIHGLAGERAGQKFGQRSVLASDVIETLPQVLCTLE